MQYEDRVRIATPEGVELDFALGGVGSRLAARIIDLILQTLIGFAAVLGLGLGLSGLSGVAATIAAIIVSFAVLWGYDVLFETFNSGRTPGKARLGLRVVGEMGEPESFSMAAVRNLLRIVDNLVGPIAIIVSKRNQRLGDMAAGTLVVKERSGGAEAKLLRSAPEAVEKPDTARIWDLAGVTSEEMAAVRRFLERRGTIGPRARAEIAHELAERLRRKVHNSEQAGADERFLELLVAVKSQR